jgi:hypothetical protein
MKKQRLHTTWLNFKNTRLYCVDLSGCDKGDLRYLKEIQQADAVICSQPADSLLMSLDLSHTRMAPEIETFIHSHRGSTDPIRKLAVLGLSDWQRIGLSLTRRLVWPANTRFFTDYESAKEWLARETG